MRSWICCIVIALMATSTGYTESSKNRVISTYSDIAYAIYDDSTIAARELQEAISLLAMEPTEQNLNHARNAWLKVRIPYQQSEAFRFGNPIVDEFDNRLNAWPVDESFIDYVEPSALGLFGLNEVSNISVIQNLKLTHDDKLIDTAIISEALLQHELHGLGGNEAFVATGFHAIEFLLWGQDLNSVEPIAGNRPATDFDPTNCIMEGCLRRLQYLQVATALLVSDLTNLRDAWAADGIARSSLTSIPENEALGRIIKGLGSLAYGELAGERIKLGLLLQDPEEEHDCFSDNTHNSHFYNVIGLRNVYFGEYMRISGEVVSGTSMHNLLHEHSPEAAATVQSAFEQAVIAFSRIKQHGEYVEHYDQMIFQQNAIAVSLLEDGIDSLVRLAKTFERASEQLELNATVFEGSHSLDSPSEVFE